MTFFTFSCKGLSSVQANRVPIATASAPKDKAANSPRPSPNPPAAIRGSSGTLDAMAGTNTKEVTSPPCAAASWPVTSRASAPLALADLAGRGGRKGWREGERDGGREEGDENGEVV